MERNAQTLSAILELLDEVGARHAIFGGLATFCHGRARATSDVDMLVSAQVIEPLRAGLERRGYAVRRYPHVMKMYRPGERASVGDFVPYEANGVLRATYAAKTPAVIMGLPVTVVQCGAFVALKFEAAATATRLPQRRAQDVRDIHAVLKKGFAPEDERLAIAIAGLMYEGAVADLQALIEDLRQGRPTTLAMRTRRRAGLLVRQGLSHFGSARSRRA